MQKLRVAWFSPLDIDESNIDSPAAYSSALLLPVLRDSFDIEIFHDGFEQYRDFTSWHYLSAFERHAENPFDIFFYQVEDRPSSRFLRIAPALMPGIVWFHDLIFMDDGPEPVLNSPWETVVNKYFVSHTPWPVRGYEFTKDGPVGYREAGMCFSALFSSERDHDLYLQNVSVKLAAAEDALSSMVLPFPVDLDSLSSVRRKEFSPESFTIGFCGSPRIESRIHKLFESVVALANETGVEANVTWCLEESESEAAQEIIEEFQLGERVRLILGRSAEAWAQTLHEVDIAVHTLFSVYGHPGPYLEMSLAAGLPVISTRFGASGFLPEETIFQIEAGETEALQIRAVIEQILKQDQSQLFEAQREFAAERYDHRAVAAELARVFTGSHGRLRDQMASWMKLHRDARMSLLNEVRSLASGGEDNDLSARLLEPLYQDLGWSEGLSE